MRQSSAVYGKIRYFAVLLTINVMALAVMFTPSISPAFPLSSDGSASPEPQVLAATETAMPPLASNDSAQNESQPERIIAGKPQRVVVDSLGIDLPVSDGYFSETTGEWTLGYDQAYFATPTVLANESYGSTLIYAHNLEGLFAPLHRIAPGATLTVYTDNDLIFRYTFRSSVDVAPGAVQSIESDGLPQVILQTCTGNWSERRSLFTFRFDGVERA